MKPILEVKNITKKFSIGKNNQPYLSLRESLFSFVKRTPKSEDFLALSDISFNVNQGDSLAIVGKNGAGKSTLLKILSKITPPSSGKIICRGRIASLLEVGTGFHPELTGRENVYLNGSILGLKRIEIKEKFDEIIDFSGVEKFLDTPLKHYSSGMQLRLAFAVAAHLNPEILVIDEVLAVGDAEFQSKCLGKMNEVSKSGRTILFVSHNMQSVKALCNKAIELHQGKIVSEGSVEEVVSNYLAKNDEIENIKIWNKEAAPGNSVIKLFRVSVVDDEGNSIGTFRSSKNLFVEFEFELYQLVSGLNIGFDIFDSQGVLLARGLQSDLAPENWLNLQKGKNKIRCVIPNSLLNSGSYFLSIMVGLHSVELYFYINDVIKFDIIVDHGVSPYWNNLNKHIRPGLIAPVFNWELVKA